MLDLVNIRVQLLSMLFLLTLCSDKLSAQCGGYSFKVDDSLICLNQVVTFKALNIPSGTQYTWYLGLDTIKGLNKDTVSTGYTKTGKFDIKLRVKLGNGDSCVFTKKEYIEVGKAPNKPSIQISSKSICDLSEKVRFTNTAAGISKWIWNIGQVLYKDSTQSVSHKFINAGYFDVSLTVEDFSGCQSTTVIDSAVLVERRPGVNLKIRDTSFCDTHTVFLKPTFNMYGQKGFGFDWAFPGANPAFTANRVPGKLFFNGRGRYGFQLTIYSSGNCKYDYDFLDTIRIGKSVDFTLKKENTVPCNQQEHQIELVNTSDFVAPIEWEFQRRLGLFKHIGLFCKGFIQKARTIFF